MDFFHLPTSPAKRSGADVDHPFPTQQYNASEFLRKEILRKSEKIVSLESLIERREAQVKSEQEALVAAATQREDALKQEMKHKEADFKRQIANLEAEIEAVMAFKKRRDEVEAETERLRVEAEDLRAGQAVLAAELERKFIEQNTKLKKEYERKLEDMKRSAEENIDERLDASVKRIMGQNRRMAEELRLHVQETEELQREKKILSEENSKLTREVELKREMEEQYAKRGTKQARAIKAAESKVTALEKSIAKIVSDFGDERERLTGDAKEAKATAADDAASLQRLLRLRTRELANIKRLATEVVRQRGEVERFMIDSLETVKREILVERRAAMGLGQPPGSSGSSLSGRVGTGTGTLPSIGGKGMGGGGGKLSGARRSVSAGNSREVDIADLAWEDRERVLRLLFSKLNSGGQGTYAHGGKMPPHSFDVEGAGAMPLSHSADDLAGLMSEGMQPGFV